MDEFLEEEVRKIARDEIKKAENLNREKEKIKDPSSYHRRVKELR